MAAPKGLVQESPALVSKSEQRPEGGSVRALFGKQLSNLTKMRRLHIGAMQYEAVENMNNNP